MRDGENTVKTHNERHRFSKGQVLVLAALSLTVLIGFVGLASDAGYFFDYKRRMAAAADSASVAGAMEAQRNLDSTQVATVARTAAATSGFTHGTDGITVTVNRPPTSGYNVGNNKFVEVLINRPSPTFFLRVLNITTATVAARAVAGPGNGGGGCVYVLNSSGDQTFKLTGSATLNVPTCRIVVLSNSSSAMSTSGSACAHAASIDITGHLSNSSSCSSTPTPNTTVPPENDPLSNLQAPTWSGCTHSSRVSISGGTNTLDPGTYCGGISISNATVTFNPGLYILAKNTNNSAGVGITASSSALSGTGVTFYVDSGAASVSGGNSVVHMEAPTSGTWEGILFFQSRANTTKPASFTGGGNIGLEGVLYFPKVKVTYSGGTTTNADYTVIVADELALIAPSGVNSNYAKLTNGTPIKESLLVE